MAMSDPRPIPPPPLPPIVAAAPQHMVVGAWIVRLHAGAGAWVWPVGRPVDDEATWIDGVDDAEEAVEIVEAERRRVAARPPEAAKPGSRRIEAPVDRTDADRVRSSGLLGQLTNPAIADQLGVSLDTVRYVQRVDGIPRVREIHSSTRMRQETDALVRDAWAQGLRRDVDIAALTGLSDSAVGASKRRQGLYERERQQWTEERVQLLLSHKTPAEAAAALGITPAAAKTAMGRFRARLRDGQGEGRRV